MLERYGGVAHEANARGVDSGEVRGPGRVQNTKRAGMRRVGLGWAGLGRVWFVFLCLFVVYCSVLFCFSVFSWCSESVVLV